MSSIDFHKVVNQVSQKIIEGKVILYPTDTVWGIGCDATKEESISRIFHIKQRPATKSVILLLADVEQLYRYVEVSSPMLDFLQLQNKPTTIIYPSTLIPLAKSVYASDGSVAIRIVEHDFCKALLHKIKVPLVSTSANISNEPPPKGFDDIHPDILRKVDCIVPPVFHQSTTSQPSQIVRFSQNGDIVWIRH